MTHFTGKKVLVTGGFGFIGSNLVRRLVDLGADITVMDSMVPEQGGNLFNLGGVRDKVQAYFYDVRNEFNLPRLVKDKEYIFNLAGQTSHLESMKDPFIDSDVNARAQISLLEACRKYNTGVKIIFASTRQLYGKPDYLPVDETHPVHPVDVNGINKWAGEQYHLLYNNVYGIRSSILRLTNTYGPGMRIKDARQNFLGIWIRLLLEHKPFEIWEGHHLRDLNYVDDVVDAFILAAEQEKANGQVYNLGAVPSISLTELGNLLISINQEGDFIAKEYPAERKKIDIGDYYSDYRKITRELGWNPKISHHDGLIRTLKFYIAFKERYLGDEQI